MIRLLTLSGLAIALLILSACSVIASVAKEGALSVTGRSGWETFNLTGELPPEFGVDVTVWYAPIKINASCETDDFYSTDKRRRTHAKSFEQDFSTQAQTFNFKVPLKYSVGLCAMQIARVDMEINGRYGNKDWQRTYDDGGLRFVTALPEGSPVFNDKGILEIVGKCEWTFRDMPARGELVKILNCKGAGAYLQPDQLADKTVKFKIEVNPQERPYYDRTWIKFPEGWKPCLPKQGWLGCQEPPLFKTFKMNGQTCTVYPDCKEQ
jgi:hypothetical protein